MFYLRWCSIVSLMIIITGGCAAKNRCPSDSNTVSHGGNCPSVTQLTSGMGRMSHPEWLPYMLPVGTVTKQFAAYDLTGDNADGSFTKAFVMYKDANGEVVIFDEYGPGCLYRQQLNIWLGGDGFEASLKKNYGRGHLKYYFDNEKTPRLDISADDFFGGKVAPFTQPFNFLDDVNGQPSGPLHISRRFGNSYYPLPFEKRLKITFTPNEDWSKRETTWYQYTYLAFPTAEGIKTWTGPTEDSQLLRRQWSNIGSDPKPTEGNVNFDSQKTIEPGKTETIFDHAGQGSVAALKFKLEPYNKDTFFNTNILIYWDDQSVPSISLPISYLFGGGGKDFRNAPEVVSKTLKNLFYGFDSANHTFYCYWPMPFWSRAKIDIQNSSKDSITISSHIELRNPDKIDYPKNKAGYFCAKRTVDYNYGFSPFCNVLEESGGGHVVGTSFFTQDYSMDGDEFVYIDSSRTPQIHGSGTEDDHNQGFGGSAYQKPLWGGLFNGFQGSYRIYMGEPYIFYDSININFEYFFTGNFIGGTNKERSDVVYFYYKSPAQNRLLPTDEVDVGSESSERSHNYRIASQTWEKTITSSYDGYEKQRGYYTATDNGRAYKGHSEFTVTIDPANNGVRLRKRISRFENGLQTATVYVDGKKVTERPWHIVQPSTAPARQAWLDSDFQIPASYTKGKSSIKLRMEYAGSYKGEINEFYYWIYSYVPQK